MDRHTSVSKLKYIPNYKVPLHSQIQCDACSMSKMHKLPFSDSMNHKQIPFELIHADVLGLYKVPTFNGKKFFVTLDDNYSRTSWTYLIHTKSQVTSILSTFLAYVQHHFQTKPKYFRIDNDIECLISCRAHIFNTVGIVHQKSIIYTPQQNGVIEKKIYRHLLDTARSILHYASLPVQFW